MSSSFQIPRLSFAGTPAERFALFHSRKSALPVVVLLVAALLVTAVLYA